MPKKNKKAAPFMTFVKEYQRRHRKLKLEEAIAHCGPIWQGMSQEEKNYYKNKCKNVVLNFSHVERCSSQGVPLSVIDNERKELERQESEMLKEITETVARTRNVGTLGEQKYYFIMGNYFYHQMQGDIFYPAEIGICEYNLNNGVTNKYHSLLNPNNDIFGYTYEAQTHSKSTHGLPIPSNDALGETDLGSVYLRLFEFLSNSGCSEIPPVYTHNNYIRILRSMLLYMKNQCDYDVGTIRVFRIQQLFYELKKVTAEIGNSRKPNSIHITNAVFDQDYYEHQSAIACEFHEHIDKSKYCAMSYAIRWGYTFSDNMCADLNIDMKPGYHVPHDIDITLIATNLNKSGNTEKLSNSDSEDPFNYESAENNDDDTITSCERYSNEQASSSDDDDDDNDEAYNAWAARRKLCTAQVDDDDFAYSSSIGRGTGFSMHPLRTNQSDSIYSDATSSSYNPWAAKNKLYVSPEDDDDFAFSVCSAGRGKLRTGSLHPVRNRKDNAFSDSSISTNDSIFSGSVSGRGKLFY